MSDEQLRTYRQQYPSVVIEPLNATMVRVYRPGRFETVGIGLLDAYLKEES